MRKIRTSLPFRAETEQSFSNYSGKKNILTPAFSLMEMMVVLLIVAIIAAASAPMITKKMAKGAVNGDSPWVFTSLRGDLAYNTNGGDRSVIIGAAKYDDDNEAGPKYPRLVLATGDENQPGFVFADSDGKFLSMLSQSDSITAWNTRAAGKEATTGVHSVAIGTNQTISQAEGVTAIGDGVTVNSGNTVAIGYQANAGSSTFSGDVAIGYQADAQQGSVAVGNGAKATKRWTAAFGNNAQATKQGCTAIGSSATANQGDWATAIGDLADATGKKSTAIGYDAKATGEKSTAIGYEAKADKANQITLGTAYDTVYIPGKLVVDRDVILARAPRAKVYMSLYDHGSNGQNFNPYGSENFLALARLKVKDFCDESNVYLSRSNKFYYQGADYEDIFSGNTTGSFMSGDYEEGNNAKNFYNSVKSQFPWLSDRRLKNVGEKYTAGLAEIKKIDFFHYTFKKDEAKKPHVGVIAQDLEQIFPDSVTKGEDGYLRIRWDEMFYAVINAVKELDSRITAITENVKANFDKIAKLEETISEQQKTIEELKAQNEEFKAQNEIYEKQFELMEKRLSKVERGKGVKW